jgi:putative PEP-CTERM system histidine kinase
MVEALGIWSHALAATMFVALALWQSRAPTWTPAQGAFAGALAGTAFWALVVALSEPASIAAALAESLRNLGWLGWLFALLREGARDSRRVALSMLFVVVGVVGVAEMLVALVPVLVPDAAASIRFAALALRLVTTIGALVLVHNLYTAAAPEARSGLRLPLIALAVLWSYDLSVYGVAALAERWSASFLALRGMVALLTAPAFGLALRRPDGWKMQLSRTVAFQSLSLVAILFYFGLLALLTVALDRIGGDYARLVQVGFVFATTLAALAFLPSDRFRAWFKVKLAKHFFAHRYDYRAEWLRFTETIGAPGPEAPPLGERAVRALADITDSSAGLLLTPDETGALIVQAAWQWGPTGGEPVPAPIAERLATAGRVIHAGEEIAPLPEWLRDDPRLWAIVPLLHFDGLAGLVVLARPPVDRGLDWEDFELLQIAGRQLASYLSEARGQQALSDARRFDEFNRRFAFILHDIKNLVSQLNLVARNAERHADNPAFRADMVETLKDSAGKLADLLARLSPHDKSRPEEPRAIAALSFVASLAARPRAGVEVTTAGDPELMLRADPVRLEQAFVHLLQNAIDASPAGASVAVTAYRRGLEGAIEIVDQGQGMSSEFMRTQLFRPFASTKAGGFGIGAYEARALVASMGGRIEVESHEGVGSRFTIVLPRAGAEVAA